MSSNEYEVRYTTDIRAADNGRLTGYAAVFNSRSVDLGGFVEVIKPGAFQRSLREMPDVLALVEHDFNKVLARVSNSTLTIAEDERGLRFDLDPADTSYGRDIVELVRRGDVYGASFRFRVYPNGSHLDTSTTPAIRTLTSVQLSEVSIVVNPAYPATDVSVRHALEAAHHNRRAKLRLVAAL
jgi:uncharacterized protein